MHEKRSDALRHVVEHACTQQPKLDACPALIEMPRKP